MKGKFPPSMDMFLEQLDRLFPFTLSPTFQSLCYLGQWSTVLINFPNAGSTPSRTVGNGHCNNNNRKSNLNYALKRLGQNNPLNKQKWGGGESACDRMQGGGSVCVDAPLPDSGICVRLC